MWNYRNFFRIQQVKLLHNSGFLETQKPETNPNASVQDEIKLKELPFDFIGEPFDEFQQVSLKIENALQIQRKQYKSDASDNFCYVCNSTYSSKSELKNHIDRVHVRHNKVACDHCSYSSTMKKDLRIHLLTNHVKFKPNYACDVCGITKSKKIQLVYHMKSTHLKQKVCELGKFFIIFNQTFLSTDFM
jgi:hypothetical protein